MIQIIGLRPFFNAKKNKEDTKHELFGEIETVPALFENIDAVIEKIPTDQRWNMYFTVADCIDPRLCKGQLRRFNKQEIFPFDIDGIDLSQRATYIDIFFKVTGLDRAKTVVICSGNGLQFFVWLDKPFDSALYFDEKRSQFIAICERIDKALVDAKLKGKGDPSVWSGARLMRLINTTNKKKNREDKPAFFIEGKLAPQSFDWAKIAGLPDLDPTDHIKEWDDKKQIKLDHKEIYSKCNFMKATLEGKDFREPHFYAALSIIGRMDDGLTRAKNLRDMIKSSGSDSSVASFTDSDVEKKWKQALEASGPRTCKNIDAVWGKCESCPMYKKCVSPVSIKGADHIATRDTGFHFHTKEGPRPAYDDLLKFFDEQFKHKTIESNGLVYIYKDKRYQLMSEFQIKNFAYQHFRPIPKASVVNEFYNTVRINSLVSPEFFGENTNGLTNFQNGILNLKTKEFLPHTSEYGFRYILPFDFDPHAPAPRFNKFLDEITCDDKELRAVLEEFGGYALSGDEYWSHHCLLMLGEGRNGKSKFVEALQLVAGEENFATTKLEKFGSQNDLQLMESKLFNISEEISHREMRMTETLKDLSSGNTMTVKLMWHQPYKIKNRAKILLTANKLPETTDLSYAFFERMIIVPFNARFTGDNKDPFLAEKFKKELAGIYNVFLAGYERLLKNRKFSKSMKIDEEKADYAMGNNPLAAWFETRLADGQLIVKPLNGKTEFTLTLDLYTDFCMWAQTHGGAVRLTHSSFSYFLMAILDQGKDRKARLRHRLSGGSKGPDFPNQRWGFYDVVYKGDYAQQ